MPDLVAARAEAAVLAGDDPPEAGWCRWIEQRLIDAGELGFSPWWRHVLLDFWRSGKTAFACAAGFRAAKSTSVISMAEVPAALFRERAPFAGAELVLPIMSADVTEANGRLFTVASCLRSIGLREARTKKTSRDGEVTRIGPGEFFLREGGQGRGGCEFLDVGSNRVEIRVQPASLSGASGYTGIDVMADEIDVWDSKIATRILETLMARLKGQEGTKAYLISKPFDGALTQTVERGDMPGTYIARVGVDGVAADEAGRRAVREQIIAQGDRATRSFVNDARWTEKGDADSPYVPSWVALPLGPDGTYSPEVAALECWRLSSTGVGLEDGEFLLDGFFRAYGARPTGAMGSRVLDPELLKLARDRSRLALLPA